jgi:hypothetical protein
MASFGACSVGELAVGGKCAGVSLLDLREMIDSHREYHFSARCFWVSSSATSCHWKPPAIATWNTPRTMEGSVMVHRILLTGIDDGLLTTRKALLALRGYDSLIAMPKDVDE